MKLIQSFFIVLLIFPTLAYAAPEAILTGVKGAVQVVQGGKTTAGKNGITLNAGDTVRVGAGGAATVYYANRPPQTLGANQQVQVAAPGATPKPSVWNNVYKGVAAGFARRGEKVGGTVRGDDPPFASEEVVLLSPINSRVLLRPVLWWVLRDAPGDFQVTLNGADGNALWQGQTSKTSITIPPETPLTAGTKYQWNVTPRSRDAAGKMQLDYEKSSLNSWFVIAPEAEVASVRQEQAEIAAALKDESENTRRLAQATALAERGFYDEAIALLTNHVFENSIVKGDVRAALMAFDAMLANWDEAARWQLRKSYSDTKQIELGNRIAPDLTAPPVSGQTKAIDQSIAS